MTLLIEFTRDDLTDNNSVDKEPVNNGNFFTIDKFDLII